MSWSTYGYEGQRVARVTERAGRAAQIARIVLTSAGHLARIETAGEAWDYDDCYREQMTLLTLSFSFVSPTGQLWWDETGEALLP